MRSFHKSTRPDLVPSQTLRKSTESYRHFRTLRHRYVPLYRTLRHRIRTPHKGRTGAPHKDTCTRAPHKAPRKEPRTSPHKARTIYF